MLGGSSSASSPTPSKTLSRELHLMRFDKLLDTLTLFFSSDFASTFYVAFFLHHFPSRSLVVFPPSCSFGAFVAWQTIFQDHGNILIQKMSATRTVVSIEMLYLFSNMKGTNSNLNFKFMEVGEDVAFT